MTTEQQWTQEELDVAQQVDDLLSMMFGGDMFVRIRPEFMAIACDIDPILARRAEGMATIDGPFRAHFEQVLAIRAARAARRAVDRVQGDCAEIVGSPESL